MLPCIKLRVTGILLIQNDLDCKLIELLRFLNKCYLLQLKYFFKVRFACEIKLVLPKCANINNVVFIRRKRQALTKRDVNNSFFIAFVI